MSKYKQLRKAVSWLNLPDSKLDSLFVGTASRTAEWAKYEGLGDAALRVVVASVLFDKASNKGELHEAVESRLSNTSSYMIGAARALGFEALLKVHETTVTDKMLVDTLEAFIGICYAAKIFSGKNAEQFVIEYFTSDRPKSVVGTTLAAGVAVLTVAGTDASPATLAASRPAAGGAGASSVISIGDEAKPTRMAAGGLFSASGGAGAGVAPPSLKAEKAKAAEPAMAFLSRLAELMKNAPIDKPTKTVDEKALAEILSFVQATKLDLDVPIAHFGGDSIMSRIERWTTHSTSKHIQVVAVQLTGCLKASVGPKP